MTHEEFESIQQPTWIRVKPTDYCARAYFLISKVNKLSKRRGTEALPKYHTAYFHAVFSFFKRSYPGHGWEIDIISDRDAFKAYNIERASFVKRWSDKDKLWILNDIFSGKRVIRR